MRVLIQWATSAPGDYMEYEVAGVSDARKLPRKPAPTSSSSPDAQLGWYAAICIQGVVFTGYDHIGFEFVGGTLIVKCWNDDPDDFPAGTRWAQVWQLAVPGPDAALGGAVNTRQTCTWYGEPQSAPVQLGVPGVLPYADFVPPPSNATIHGVWLTDQQWSAHEARRSAHGWREWVPA